jgi:LPS export ABC transporter protein LptC
MALILALVLLAVIALRYRPESRLQKMVQALPKGIDVALQDIDYTHIEDGRARWRLVAQQVERQAESGFLRVDGPQMTFYDDGGETKGSLQADEGVISDNYQKVGLNGEVVLKNPSGYVLYTDHLDYDQATRMATTDAHVRLLGEGLSLEGTGLVFDVQKSQLRLQANVKGTFDSVKTK